MTVTRKSLAAEWEREDAIIESANTSKRDAANRYRAQLAAKGWPKDEIKAELEAFRKAFARARQIAKHGVNAVEESDARVEEILLEIRGSNAPRATRVEIIEEFGSADEPEHDADGVIIENTEPAHSDPQGAAAAPAEGSDEPSLPSAIQSTAAGTDRQDSTEGEPAPVALDREAATTPPASESPPVDTPSEAGDEDGHVAMTAADHGPTVNGNVASNGSAGGENVDAEADSAGGRDSSPAVASNIIKIGSGKPLRPFCLHLDDLTKCGGYGKQHCGPCLKAHADAEGLTA